mgnify:CR=1 FL=1
MTVKQLRGWHPDWEWSPSRHGMSWIYYGKKGERCVHMEAFATMWDGEGEYGAEWWAAEGDTKAPYAMWAVENMETV